MYVQHVGVSMCDGVWEEGAVWFSEAQVGGSRQHFCHGYIYTRVFPPMLAENFPDLRDIRQQRTDSRRLMITDAGP